MAQRVTRITKSLQLLELTKLLMPKKFSKYELSRRISQIQVGLIVDCLPLQLANGYINLPSKRINPGISRGHTRYCQRRVCLYDVKFTPDLAIFCNGGLNLKKLNLNTTHNTYISMYIGTDHGCYYINRKIKWGKDMLELGPVTEQFLKTLLGPCVNKVVYNDSLDLACFLKYNCNIDLYNVLDLSYIYIAQSQGKHMTTSISMIREMQSLETTSQKAIDRHVSKCNKRQCHELAAKHLTLSNKVTDYLLNKQGHPEKAWKQTIQDIICTLTSQTPRCFYIQSEYDAISQGEFTASAFKGHLLASIDRVIGKPYKVLKYTGNGPIVAVLKSKSFLDKTALLSMNIFVASRPENMVKPLYGMVTPELFHQFEDIQVGETVEVVPIQKENGIVRVFNIYDKVCCDVKRQHGETLFYDVRKKKLVPRVTHPH